MGITPCSYGHFSDLASPKYTCYSLGVRDLRHVPYVTVSGKTKSLIVRDGDEGKIADRAASNCGVAADETFYVGAPQLRLREHRLQCKLPDIAHQCIILRPTRRVQIRQIG